MELIGEKVGYNVLELLGQDDILDTSEYPVNNRKVVVFDDLINAPDKIQNTDGRHSRMFAFPECLRFSITEYCGLPFP